MSHNLVQLDMTAFREAESVVSEVMCILLSELRELCPHAGEREAGHPGKLTSALTDVVDATGRQFVFIIDGWDAPLRERWSRDSQEDWE